MCGTFTSTPTASGQIRSRGEANQGKNDYPCVAVLAHLVLCCPATSAATERLFSTGGRVVGKDARVTFARERRAIVLRHELQRFHNGRIKPAPDVPCMRHDRQYGAMRSMPRGLLTEMPAMPRRALRPQPALIILLAQRSSRRSRRCITTSWLEQPLRLSWSAIMTATRRRKSR